MGAVSVIIAEDHPIVQAGIRALLETVNIECVGIANDGEEAVQLTKQLQPDVALLDIELPKISGIEATAQIKSSCPKTAVLVFSAFNYDHFILGSIQAGADGYILKSAHPNDLIDAIRKVHNGEKVFDLKAAHRLLYGLTYKRNARVHDDRLRRRELEVLKLVAKGSTNKGVASELGISVPTVGTHLLNIFRKLGVQSRTEAVTYAIQQGWIGINDLLPK